MAPELAAPHARSQGATGARAMRTPGRGHRWDEPLWLVFLVSAFLSAAIFGPSLWLVDQVVDDTPSFNLLSVLFYGLGMGMLEVLLERRRRRRGALMRERGAPFDSEGERQFARRAGVTWGEPRGNRLLQVVGLLFLTGSFAVQVVMPEGAPQRELWSMVLLGVNCALVIAALIRQSRYRRKGARRE